MGAIMVFGILGLGLAAPIVFPAVWIYDAFERLFREVKEFFNEIKI